MDYLEFSFTIVPVDPGIAMVNAYLADCGFESFLVEDSVLKAYIPEKDFNKPEFKASPIWNLEDFEITYAVSKIVHRNWNAEWEAGFKPIVVDASCGVRAPFHAALNLPYEIVISPNMSFGTGHHETTQLMLQGLLDTAVEGKSVLDMGCGTGVLGILAALKGARTVTAVDIDPVCVENTAENARLNNCSNITVVQGNATVLESLPEYDVIVANINKNTLLADLPQYSLKLKRIGLLYLSGFYKDDLQEINQTCRDLGLSFEKKWAKNNWVASKYVF